jgi:hypothetical protein
MHFGISCIEDYVINLAFCLCLFASASVQEIAD